MSGEDKTPKTSKIKSSKTPKNVSKIKTESADGGPQFSVCGLYEISSRDNQCFNDNKVIQFLNQAKQEVFETREDFENLLMGSINSFSTITYQSHETSKYLTLKCSKCSRFKFWFHNKDDLDMSTIVEGG